MNQHRPPELDMTIDGEFVSPPTPPLSSRIMLWAFIIAVIAGALSLAAFALWLAMLVLPVALGAAAIAWVTYRYRIWRAQKTFSRQREVGRA
jgi:membrane protein implicated in regulation of membrane protease activity